MKGLLWVLVLFASAVGISLAAHFNDGYVLLVVPPYRVELSLNLTILLSLGGFLVFYGVLRGVALARSLPRRVRAFRERRQREKILATFHDAVRLLFEGRFSQAMKKAGEAHAAGQSPALAGLLAARAAQRLREPAKLDQLRLVLQGSERLKPNLTPQEITAKAAALFGGLGQKLQERGHHPRVVAHFLNRLVFCMFAEDARLLPSGLFSRVVTTQRRGRTAKPI